MLSRLLVVLVLAAAGFSAVLALPDQIRLLDSAVRTVWPVTNGAWVKMRDNEPSAQEIRILAPDTRFFKASFMREGSNLPVEAGIVLSGDDINNSIHRPERCLVAQGHGDLTRHALDLPLANGETLPVVRLSTRLRRELQREEGAAEGERQVYSFVGLTYYWFVGHDMLTASHYGRTFKDIADRLFKGSNQRWAYITVSVYLPENEETVAAVKSAGADGPVDRLLQDFIKTVIPGMIDFDQIHGRGAGK
jgi:hypothetical protein